MSAGPSGPTTLRPVVPPWLSTRNDACRNLSISADFTGPTTHTGLVVPRQLSIRCGLSRILSMSACPSASIPLGGLLQGPTMDTFKPALGMVGSHCARSCLQEMLPAWLSADD
eukprot:CAMPEP_0171122724 /NCGR_PEP_ID=MMETSP0766_2-20121228/105632_1 /TAXON_ID=439317 /ORGANISM="Gambierdiscus australes, Strain CAWD 149" /LENGTH=112 /DNA_ID=CAMNT_0011585575 /DNA_START=346 /DNA_END=684 /DNA_ORIENTATION=+